MNPMDVYLSSALKRTQPGLIYEKFWQFYVPLLERVTHVLTETGISLSTSSYLQIAVYDAYGLITVVSLIWLPVEGVPALHAYGMNGACYTFPIREPTGRYAAQALSLRIRELSPPTD